MHEWMMNQRVEGLRNAQVTCLDQATHEDGVADIA
jgi:hypothetical protein